jgi:uncharacterized membrane protein YidH (DUF202 family)
VRTRERPSESFDIGLQHERTALAWERTSIALVVSGLALVRFSSVYEWWFFAGIGLVQTAFGAAVLVWAGWHYDDLHGPLRRGDDVVHPSAARWVGGFAIAGSGMGIVVGLLVVVNGQI